MIYKNWFSNNHTKLSAVNIFILSFIFIPLWYLNFYYLVIIFLILYFLGKIAINWQFSETKEEHIYISLLILFYIIFFIELSVTILSVIFDIFAIPTISFYGVVIFTKMTFIIYSLIGLRLLRFSFILKYFYDIKDQINYIKHELLAWTFVMLCLDVTQIFLCNFKISIVIVLLILYNYNKFTIYINNLKILIFKLFNTKHKKLYPLLFSIIMVTNTKDHLDIIDNQSVIPSYMLNKKDQFKIKTPSYTKLKNDLNYKYNNITKEERLDRKLMLQNYKKPTFIKDMNSYKLLNQKKELSYKPILYSDNWSLRYDPNKNTFVNYKSLRINSQYLKSPLELSAENKKESYVTKTIKDGVTALLPNTSNIPLSKLTYKQFPLILAHAASTVYENRSNLFAPWGQKIAYPTYFSNTPHGLTIKNK